MRSTLGAGALTPVKENALSRNVSRADAEGLHGDGSKGPKED
jgi:hypothetical protein